jgi:hypothetical protein
MIENSGKAVESLLDPEKSRESHGSAKDIAAWVLFDYAD